HDLSRVSLRSTRATSARKKVIPALKTALTLVVSRSTRACSWDALNAERDAAPADEARNLVLGRPRDSGRAALRPLCEELAGLGQSGALCAAHVPGSPARG